MRVYIAGPYRSKWGLIGRALNVIRHWRVARKYWAAGHTVISPICNSAFMDGAIPDTDWVLHDLEFLVGCDLIVMLPNWRESAGATIEFHYARERGIPWEEA